VLHRTSPPPAFEVFRTAMHALGWVEGQTCVIDYWGADGRGEWVDVLAAEIVTSKPDVIMTGTSGTAAATKRATWTIPIVMADSLDPVGLGVVTRVARPGGNITGQAIVSPERRMNRLEFLNEAFPAVSRVARL
jgi:putative tryptophan/tyrosine transport system substrate-binding protein